MDSDNGAVIEDEKEVLMVEKSNGEGSTPDVIGSSHEPLSGENEACKDVLKDKEGLDSSALLVDSPTTESKSIKSNHGKDSNGNGSKNKNLAKNQTSSKGSVVFGRSTKPSLTHSLSFPDRGRHSDVMKRSIEVNPNKSDIKLTQKRGSKVESQISNGNLSPRTNLVSKGPYPGVGSSKGVSVTTAGKVATRRSTIASSTSLRRSLSDRKLSDHGNAANPATDVSVKKDSELGNKSSPVREDDDALSTTSSGVTPRTQQRINASAFSSRLEERAEKRKEIEEKIQAKEAEKSNLQAKSKENQEAEIKQLRKSLTFKATPMPAFYKEPPPKIELKKIPTTRPISPKLGRHKTSASTDGNSLDNGGSSLSPRFTRDNCNCKSPKSPQAKGANANMASKKSTKSSLSKPHTRESSTPKKIERAETESRDKQICGQNSEETQDRPHCSLELDDQIEECPEKVSFDGNGSNVASSNTETLPSGVTVEG